MHWFLDPIQYHYADFEGRVGRQEYWVWILFSIGLQIILEIIGNDVFATIVALALALPSLGLGARRLHDVGRSGWWQLLVLIPIVGWIVLIVWTAQETIPTDNEYGAPAKPKKLLSTIVVPPVTPATAVTAEPVSPSRIVE